MFDDYAAIPLAVPLPPVDIGEFREYVQSHCEACAFSGNEIRLLLIHARKPVIGGRMVMQACDPRLSMIEDRTRFDWDPVFASRFPALCAWSERLPYARLGNMCIVTQTANIREHMDIFGENNSATYYERYRNIEPQFYRAIIAEPGPAKNGSFYITQAYGGDKQYVRLPRTTSIMALSSSGCYHGADHHPGRFKSTLVYYGDLDVERHHRLLSRSIRRYPRHVIRLARRGPACGPAMDLPYKGAE